MSHVFISYVKEDLQQIQLLCKGLEAHGMKVWVDRTSIDPGARWKDAIREAIRSGAYFIACFSENYEHRSKTYMNEELILAIEELRQYSPSKKWFIPILLSECYVPAHSIGAGQTLLDFQWLNLYTDWDYGFKRLLSVLMVDKINSIKELIDEFGYRYTTRSRNPDMTDQQKARPKDAYLETVRELKDEFGIWYDPIRICE